MKPLKPIKTIGAFISHDEALFFDPSNTEGTLVRLDSGIESRIRIPGEGPDFMLVGKYRSTNNENHRHNREINDLNRYLDVMTERLIPYERIYVLGPKILVHQLKNHISADKRFTERQMVFEQHDEMTENQFRDAVKKFLEENAGLAG